MSEPWIRQPPERRHDVVAGVLAGAVAVGVGLTVFWLARLLLAREPLGGTERGPGPERSDEEGEGV